MSLTSNRALWSSFALTLLMTALFGVVMAVWDFVIIDEMFRPDAIRAHVAEMSAEQRRVHAWMTGTLDVAYPFAYGAFLGGMVLRAFPAKRWLLLPILVCIPADLVEGLSQVMILTGHDGWVAVKAVATPVKLAAYITAIGIALAGLAALVLRKRKARRG